MQTLHESLEFEVMQLIDRLKNGHVHTMNTHSQTLSNDQ